MEDQVDEKPAVAGGVDDWKKEEKRKKVWRWPSIPFGEELWWEDKLSEGGFGSVYKGICYKDGLNVSFVIIIIENSY